MANETDYSWITKSPLNSEVVLKQSTYDTHIMGDSKRTEAEVSNLIRVSGLAKNTIEKPRYIYEDNNYNENQRHKYIDLIAEENLQHIQALVVVVDTDRTPHEVVTWSIKRNLSQEKGAIIYDASGNRST